MLNKIEKAIIEGLSEENERLLEEIEALLEGMTILQIKCQRINVGLIDYIEAYISDIKQSSIFYV